MSSIKMSPNASGTGIFTIAAPNSNTDRTLTLPDNTGIAVLDTATQTLTNKTLGAGLVMGASAITAGASVASTSGTSIDFTGIPSWVKRITVMFNAVSTNGSSQGLIQVGSGSFVTSGYNSQWVLIGIGTANGTQSTGLPWFSSTPSEAKTGHLVLTNISGNAWVYSGVLIVASGYMSTQAANISLGGTLDRLRITTANGTDAFDAGTINILYE